MANLNVNNFVNVQVSPTQQGLAAYNPNNLCILTKDVPVQNYGSGATATAVVAAGIVTGITVGAGGASYGSNPPVLFSGGGGNGALAVAIVASGVITGFTVINGGTGYGTAPTVTVGSSFNVYRDAPSVALDFGSSSETAAMANIVFSQNPNILSGNSVGLIIYAMNTADTISTAVPALLAQQYAAGFIFAGYAPNNAEVEAGAVVVQALQPPTMLGAATSILSDIYPGGLCPAIQSATLQQTRMLLYTLPNGTWTAAQSSRLAMAAYMSRLMSTDFNGSNTTSTMNLKQLIGILPDTNINQTILTQAAAVGADTYAQYASLSEDYSTGANGYSDNIYNMGWFVGALQVALFNTLAQTNTKIPQTEQGMSTLKNAVIQVCEQAVSNGFIAPGNYTGTTVGNPTDCIRNIADTGFYVYSAPVATQGQTQRQARIAPLIQLAVKFAGAIQFVNLTVYPQP